MKRNKENTHAGPTSSGARRMMRYIFNPRCPILGLLAPLCLVLAGCGGTDRMVVSSIPQDDAQIRHPIVLGEQTRTLEILVEPVTGRFDGYSAAQLREYAGVYRAFGRGPITVMPPILPSGPPSTEPIRAALSRAGIRAPVVVSPYSAGPDFTAPVRLSFSGLKASVAGSCGEWPRDLAAGTNVVEDWSNKPYWNLGCAYQNAFAMQVADPRDLVTPQAEMPADTVVRVRKIEKVRLGIDPGTKWAVTGSAISAVGADSGGGQ
ncbi:MAG TPA: CpaD family pilus assembly protein [Methylocella sp.]|nr:CpaD family pilus assembly protein [Methylocella sp.]